MPSINDGNRVGALDCRQTVRDDDGCAAVARPGFKDERIERCILLTPSFPDHHADILLEGIVNKRFTFRVQSRRRLVQKQQTNLVPAKKRAGNGYTLPLAAQREMERSGPVQPQVSGSPTFPLLFAYLAARQLLALLANFGLVVVLEFHDEIVRVGLLCCLDHITKDIKNYSVVLTWWSILEPADTHVSRP